MPSFCPRLLRPLMLALALPGILGLPHAVLAEGAVAVGQPADVARDGIVFGWVVNTATRQIAEREALKQCHETRDATDATRALCAVMRSFKNECAAIAIDPELNTTGFGWSILPTLQAAESKALADCRATAGRARESFCKVSISRCDGTAR